MEKSLGPPQIAPTTNLVCRLEVKQECNDRRSSGQKAISGSKLRIPTKKEKAMAEERKTMQIRGDLSIDKIKAAQVLGGDQVKFELRAMKPVKAGQLRESCIVCFVCFVCVVCLVVTARENNIRLWKELPASTK
jgi:hypothetical protein